jgi:hypothetical protein
MKPFLDSGFLLTLLFTTNGSPVAWQIAQGLEGPIPLASLQIFNTENGLRRQIEAKDSTPSQRALAAAALQRFRWYCEQQVFQTGTLDYDIAIQLAQQWQERLTKTLPSLLLLWPALAVTIGATHFLSFDPRTRRLAQTAGLKLLPERL